MVRENEREHFREIELDMARNDKKSNRTIASDLRKFIFDMSKLGRQDSPMVNMCGRLVPADVSELAERNQYCLACGVELSEHEDNTNEGLCDDCAMTAAAEYREQMNAEMYAERDAE